MEEYFGNALEKSRTCAILLVSWVRQRPQLKGMHMAHKLVHIADHNGQGMIIPDPNALGDIAECADLWDVLEYQLCNGWDRIAPEEIGALTDGPIISQDSQRDDHGNLVKCGRIYWHERYQIENPVEVLASGKPVRLVVAD